MRNAARFAEIDRTLDRMEERLLRMRPIWDEMAEKLELMGYTVNVSLDLQQDHMRDGHGPEGDE